MTDDRRTAERRRVARRASPAATATPAEPEPSAGQALVPISPAPSEPVGPKQRRGGFGAFAAQVLGQGGQKRGLRGGPETLDRARSTYLDTEWSGPADRRPHPGRITKTEI